jgi:dihydrofolate reductase
LRDECGVRSAAAIIAPDRGSRWPARFGSNDGSLAMGKIINSTFVSIDGVINHMEVWHFGYIDDELQQLALEHMQASEALLIGRNTYDAYASSWPNRDGVLAERINSMPKYVVSTTLDKADWNNTTVIKGDLVAEAAKLKQGATS